MGDITAARGQHNARRFAGVFLQAGRHRRHQRRSLNTVGSSGLFDIEDRNSQIAIVGKCHLNHFLGFRVGDEDLPIGERRGCGHHILVRFPRRESCRDRRGRSFIFWRHRAAGTDGQRTGNNRKFECLHLFILLQGFLRFFLFNLIAEQLNNEHIEQRNEEDTQERTCQHTA